MTLLGIYDMTNKPGEDKPQSWMFDGSWSCSKFVFCFYCNVGVSENSVPLNPMVLLIIIPIKWLFVWEYTLFSDKPTWGSIKTWKTWVNLIRKSGLVMGYFMAKQSINGGYVGCVINDGMFQGDFSRMVGGICHQSHDGGCHRMEPPVER
jgi:hypothetical protein